MDRRKSNRQMKHKASCSCCQTTKRTRKSYNDPVASDNVVSEEDPNTERETAAKNMLMETDRVKLLEVRCDMLQLENNRLIDENRQLEMQLQSVNRESIISSTLQSTLESIKSSIERIESDGRAKIEEQLDDKSRDCSALRRRLQEEQLNAAVVIAKLSSEVSLCREREIAAEKEARMESELIVKQGELNDLHKENGQLQMKLDVMENTYSKEVEVRTLAVKASTALERELCDLRSKYEKLRVDLKDSEQKISKYSKSKQVSESQENIREKEKNVDFDDIPDEFFLSVEVDNV